MYMLNNRFKLAAEAILNTKQILTLGILQTLMRSEFLLLNKQKNEVFHESNKRK